MDLLQQLEGKLQLLIQQRNELREQVAALKAEAEDLKAEGLQEDEELHHLRSQAEALQKDTAAMVSEREEIRAQIAGILKLLEDVK